MGNLGRATFDRSTDGTWPWIFDECIEPGSLYCEANQCTAQRISACDAEPGFGLNPHQGRGAPEIDIVEGQPGKFSNACKSGHSIISRRLRCHFYLAMQRSHAFHVPCAQTAVSPDAKDTPTPMRRLPQQSSCSSRL